MKQNSVISSRIADNPNSILFNKLRPFAWILTVLVLFLVGLMRRVKIPTDFDFSFLPAFNSISNTFVFICLLIAYYQIKKGNIPLHRNWIFGALFFSVVFLLSYVIYHFTTVETLYGDLNGDGILTEAEVMKSGSLRSIYLILLISHIVLAGLVLPMILFTFLYAYTGYYKKHRAWARWTYPIWLYVAFTGPIVYLLLIPYY